MMVVLQWDLGAGGGCELALADEVAQSEDQFLQMVSTVIVLPLGQPKAPKFEILKNEQAHRSDDGLLGHPPVGHHSSSGR